MRLSRLGLLLLITLTPFLANAFTNVIGPGGTLVAWGDLVLPHFESGTHFAQIATGGNHVLALKGDGTMLGWGNNTWKQCIPPAAVSGNIVAVAAGYLHSTALFADGTAFTWGKITEDNWFAVTPPGLSNIVSISSSGSFTWGLRKDGTVLFWGPYGASQTNTVRDVKILSTAVTGYGGSTAFAIKNNGTVVTLDTSGNFSAVADISNAIAVAGCNSAGTENNLAIRSDGTLAAWGNGAPAIPSGMTGIKAIAVGLKHCVAVRTDGSVVAWGDNTFGQIGVPAGLNNVVQVVSGFYNNVALQSDDTIVAWGDKAWQLMPKGLPDAVMAAPYEVLRSDGTLFNWNPDPNTIPPGSSNLVAIPKSGGPVALKSDGTVVAWGYTPVNYNFSRVVGIESEQQGNRSTFGLLEDGTLLEGKASNPTPSIRATNIVGFAAADLHELAANRNGTVTAWGLSSSVLTINGLTARIQATVPPGLSNVIAVAVGNRYIIIPSADRTPYFSFSLALKADGSVIAWDGLDSPDVTDAVAIAAGGLHGLALRKDRTVYAWDGLSNMASYKMVPKGLTNVIAINAADGQSFAIVANPPTISKQPVPKQIVSGMTATFSAQVKGTAPFTYQWFHNDTALSGQTNLSLTISNAQSIVAGNYTLHVYGRGGSVVSAPGILAISNSISGRVVPQGIELTTATLPGRTYSFEVSSGLNGPWSSLGSQFPGTGSPVQVIAPVDTGESARFYRVRYNVP